LRCFCFLFSCLVDDDGEVSECLYVVWGNKLPTALEMDYGNLSQTWGIDSFARALTKCLYLNNDIMTKLKTDAQNSH